jgi:hypothetical protein
MVSHHADLSQNLGFVFVCLSREVTERNQARKDNGKIGEDILSLSFKRQ